jgi:DNA adenine methylase
MVRKSNSLPLKWHGGKQYLADKIVALFPEHSHYVEAYFGGGAVLFAKPWELVDSHSEVVNDLNGALANFWRVLGDEELFPRFQRLASATPFSKPRWEEAKGRVADDPVLRALDFFVQYRQSRQGLGRDFATMSRERTRRGMNEQVSSWLSAIEGLEDAHARIKRVVVLSEDAVSVIRREDSKSTLFYLDPPYLHETRTATKCYEHELAPEQHEELLASLDGVSGKFILSGYRSPMYDSFARKNGLRRVDIEIDNKSSGSKVKPTKIESLWFNY